MCLRCDESGYNKKFKIKGRGFGSIFDREDMEIYLCRNCIKGLGVKRKWFKNKRNKDGFYEYEDEIEALINEIGLDKVLLTNICSSSIITQQ